MSDTQNILITQAQAIVDKFGTQAKLWRALGHRSGTTVSQWLKAGYVRPVHYPSILEAARENDVQLTPDDFQLVDPSAFQQEAA